MPFIGGDPDVTVEHRVLHGARAYYFYAARDQQTDDLNRAGVGQTYAPGEMSSHGQYLQGDKTYKLHLPPNIPATLYWSITLYDTEPRSILFFVQLLFFRINTFR